jgi:hypothetical protein
MYSVKNPQKMRPASPVNTLQIIGGYFASMDIYRISRRKLFRLLLNKQNYLQRSWYKMTFLFFKESIRKIFAFTKP